MISDKHKFIFIEVPKTGTTTVCFTLSKEFDAKYPLGNTRHDGKHWDIEQYKEAYPVKFKSYFKFSFVRNPWSRVVSLYQRNEGQQWKNKISFMEFVNWIELATDTCALKSVKRDPKKNMLDFFKIDNKVEMDFIGKLENIQEDFDTVCDKIGLPRKQLGHANSSEHKHYTKYYNNKTKKMIGEKFAEDIEYFGYEFEA